MANGECIGAVGSAGDGVGKGASDGEWERNFVVRDDVCFAVRGDGGDMYVFCLAFCAAAFAYARSPPPAPAAERPPPDPTRMVPVVARSIMARGDAVG
jgi:hypothetical protein